MHDEHASLVIVDIDVLSLMNHYAPASRPSGGSRTFIDWEYCGLETELYLRPRSPAEIYYDTAQLPVALRTPRSRLSCR